MPLKFDPVTGYALEVSHKPVEAQSCTITQISPTEEKVEYLDAKGQVISQLEIVYSDSEKKDVISITKV